MLSQFSWLQFLLFVGGAAILWYVYVIFVYFGSSINEAITKPREEVAVVPVARRPVSRSIIQTEDFSRAVDTAQGPADQSEAAVLEGEAETVEAEIEKEKGEGTAGEESISILDADAIKTSEDSDMSPAVLAALTGQSYNWADSPALHMDYREPDASSLEKISEIDVASEEAKEQESEEAPEEDQKQFEAVPADDYALTVGELVRPQIQPETEETVFAALQKVTGTTALSDLVQRSSNAAGNVTHAFAELEQRGLLSEEQVAFSERFLRKGATPKIISEGTTPPDPTTMSVVSPDVVVPHIPTPTNPVAEDIASADAVLGDAVLGEAVLKAPAGTPPIDWEDYNALLDSLT